MAQVVHSMLGALGAPLPPTAPCCIPEAGPGGRVLLCCNPEAGPGGQIALRCTPEAGPGGQILVSYCETDGRRGATGRRARGVPVNM